MKRIDLLRKQQASLKEQIYKNLDLLVGTVVRSPAMMYHSLTTKVDGKTVTRYVRKGLVVKVKKMTDRNKKVRALIQKLSKVNWELLKLESKEKE
ncbi:hypothetical protein GWN26_07465 [Candidatus Saccharibacteria bacterium]|nr:hypothetical protein [Candidatus Saccharibacteria bacterium]NIW79241.1 hypothetical protein [Calditrichia bacterium]